MQFPEGLEDCPFSNFCSILYLFFSIPLKMLMFNKSIAVSSCRKWNADFSSLYVWIKHLKSDLSNEITFQWQISFYVSLIEVSTPSGGIILLRWFQLALSTSSATVCTWFWISFLWPDVLDEIGQKQRFKISLLRSHISGSTKSNQKYL